MKLYKTNFYRILRFDYFLSQQNRIRVNHLRHFMNVDPKEQFENI